MLSQIERRDNDSLVPTTREVEFGDDRGVPFGDVLVPHKLPAERRVMSAPDASLVTVAGCFCMIAFVLWCSEVLCSLPMS
jgi:hypothetical protein